MDLKTNSDTSHLGSMETDDGIISVQFLEFKTSLLDVVQELHIRRDAETRYEEQINKLVLEKQELEWQKESVQHQISSVTNQHNEALDTVKKRFQAQIGSLEEDKGRHQLTAELREKEMISLKEELKTLQLCKYSMEKKLSELSQEQKLELQTESKDGHLKQLGEVEQRFGTVSRQCTILKQAHDRLQQNVEEAIKINKKITTVNKSQESKINTLTQDVKRLQGELIKARVSSAYQSGKESSSLRERERQIQQLQQRLQMEMELNSKLQYENDAAHLEKQGVMNSLQQAQQLVHTQTLALSRSEAELLTQREEYQALKRQHELVLEEAKGKEEGFGHLKEECKNDNILWEIEKQALQQQIQSQEEKLRSVKEAYEHLHHKHKQLSAARLQADHRHSLEYGPMYSTDGDSEVADGQQPTDAHSKRVSSDEQIDPVRAEQNCTQGNDTTNSEAEPDKIIEAAEAQEMAADSFPSRPHSDFHVETQPAQADTPPPYHPDAEENRQSCPLDHSGLGQTGSPVAPVLPKSVAKDGSDDPVVSEPTNPNVNQAPGLYEHNQSSASLNVDELPVADKSSSDSSSRGMVHWSGELSVAETSSVYGAENDPVAGGKGEVGVQQTLCTPEARHPQSPDKGSDSQAVAPAQGTVCTETQPQTPAAEAAPHNASTSQTAGECETVASAPETDQARQFTGDGPIKVAASAQLDNNSADIPQGLHTPISQSQQPAEPSSSQCLDQPQNDFSHLALQSRDDLSSCVPEAKHLHIQNEECLPVTREKVEAVQGVNPEKHVPAVTADAKCSYVSPNMGSPELFPPTSSAVEADPPQVARPSEETRSSDGQEHQGSIPADAQVTPQTSNAEAEGDERSPSRAADHRGAPGTKPHRSSFVWGGALPKSLPLLMGSHGAEGSPGDTQGSAVCTVSTAAPGPAVSEHRSTTPHWRFLEVPSTLSAPIFQQDRLNKRDSAANARSAGGSDGCGIHPGHKRDQQETWNVIRQSLSEMAVGMESRVSIAFSAPASGTPAAAPLPGGNRLRQDCPPSRSLIHPRHQSLTTTQSSQAKQEWPSDDIRAQIAKIEQFLSSEGVSLPKKSKIEEKEDVEL
ncbi:uncharacterized protein LOC125303598 isoform X2 [Alosa alosa]|uniref:uncharacterized protein LOC125303598 isoform X2 n=1 Tax=Alosa alosa TaxID=278164 RepID=UPI0020153F00|nr:uncharacterized protein LOC125303598 isoform X2 [Alosa alosa]